MAQNKIPETYAEALFDAKRGFVIIGLTGFTGSGCSKTAGLLSRSDKFLLPPTLAGHSYKDDLFGDKHYNLLRNHWDQFAWEPFTRIEVAAVLFGILLRQSLLGEMTSDLPEIVHTHANESREKLAGLSLLLEDKRLTEPESSQLIKAYQCAVEILRQIKDDKPISDFIQMMQTAGDRIRLFGSYNAGRADPRNIKLVPEAIRKVISAYKRVEGKKRFVVDAFRNPFEVEFFKRRYAEFYLICMVTAPEHRAQQVRGSMTERDLQRVWDKESGKISGGDHPGVEIGDVARKVTGQDIPGCAQKADVFIAGSRIEKHLYYHLARLLILIHKPGAVVPSRDEYCMQLAATARNMSGCLSRQVGAVLVKPNGYVVGVGWNNPPEGQAPCSVRSCSELLDGDSEDSAYSQFERSEEFRAVIRNKNAGNRPFCFRSEYARLKNERGSEFTRALHAEENAILQTAKLGGMSVQGATLYTTASTCTLCAKKAYHLDVGRVVFIDEYPGIARDQTIVTGKKDIVFNQFEGITGSAYFSLFSPLMPEKDLFDLY